MLIKEHDVFKLEVIFEYFAERAIVILRIQHTAYTIQHHRVPLFFFLSLSAFVRTTLPISPQFKKVSAMPLGGHLARLPL